MRLKSIILAAGVLALSAGAAAAATVTNDLNLRSGPGTGYGVITSMPAGAYVDVIGCDGSWCQVEWQGTVGYASASYLAGGGGGYAAVPPPVYYGAPAAVFGFGVGNRYYGGSRYRYRHHRGYSNRGHYRSRGGNHDGSNYRSGNRSGNRGGGTYRGGGLSSGGNAAVDRAIRNLPGNRNR